MPTNDWTQLEASTEPCPMGDQSSSQRVRESSWPPWLKECDHVLWDFHFLLRFEAGMDPAAFLGSFTQHWDPGEGEPDTGREGCGLTACGPHPPLPES